MASPKKPRNSGTPLRRGRRGRPTQEQAAAIDEVVVRTAREMFLTDGYGVTAMETIASRARVSKGTLYARFPSKAELFEAVVKERVAAWSAAAATHNHGLGTTLKERLVHHATIFLDSMALPEIDAFSRLMLAETRRFPALGRIYHQTAHQFAVNIIATEIASATALEGKPARDALNVANTFVETLWGWSARHALLNFATSTKERRTVATQRVAILLEGRAAW